MSKEQEPLTLKDVATISGKPGLYKVVKPTRSGVIVEPLEAGRKKKEVVRANQQISILKEISIYTTTEEESIALAKVLLAVHEKYGKELPVSKKSSEEELYAFMGEVAPDFDRERVYPSDVRKMVQWYGLLDKEAPEILDGLAEDIAKDEAGVSEGQAGDEPADSQEDQEDSEQKAD